MRTVQMTVYRFHELSRGAKDRAKNDYQQRENVPLEGEYMTTRDPKFIEMRGGGRVIVNDEWLDANQDDPNMPFVRTCMNKNRCGVNDAYVAWMCATATPADLVYVPDREKGQVAVGSL